MTRKWGTASSWVYRFLIERDGSICYLCQSEADEKGSKTLWIEHMDNNSNNPSPSNLRLAHPSCNEKKNPPHQLPQPVLSERESESWSSAEGARSDKMRPRYRLAMYHPATGLFRNPGQQYPKQWTADILQEELCKIGTATTYLKYIGADISAEYLAEKQLDGTWFIERTLKPYPLEKLGMRA